MGSTTNGTQSESQTAFIVAAAVLLGLPFIVLLGMAAFVLATGGAGLIPANGNDLPSESTSKLMIFLVVWGVVSVVAVLMFVARLLRRSSS